MPSTLDSGKRIRSAVSRGLAASTIPREHEQDLDITKACLALGRVIVRRLRPSSIFQITLLHGSHETPSCWRARLGRLVPDGAATGPSEALVNEQAAYKMDQSKNF
jgi:hypothetical protein